MSWRSRREASHDSAAYLETLNDMEQHIHAVDPGAFYASTAISLRRSADYNRMVAIALAVGAICNSFWMMIFIIWLVNV